MYINLPIVPINIMGVGVWVWVVPAYTYTTLPLAFAFLNYHHILLIYPMIHYNNYDLITHINHIRKRIRKRILSYIQ